MRNVDEALPRRFGKYTLIKKLAMGGMAELFLALHRSVAGFEKLIVIKRILPTLSADGNFTDMFLAEARIAATLNHPNIVQIFDVGSIDGTYFIAMEFINGEDLRAIVRAMRERGISELPLEHALAIGQGLLAGLTYAHEKVSFEGEPLHLVHRDISPQNVLVTFSGDVKVVDFGIAKTGRGEDTRAGQLKGKVPYMSPEQCRGESLDCRSDVFSAGIILYELTTNRRLFRSQNEFQTLRMIVEGEYPLPTAIRPGFPAALEQIILKALAKDKDRRYQTARQALEDLEGFVREGRLRVGASGLQTFMQSLFEQKLAAQKEALQAGRQLADIIAAQEEERSQSSVAGRAGDSFLLSDADIEEVGTPSTAAQSPLAKAEASRGPDTKVWLAEKQKHGSRRVVLATAAVLVVAGAIGGTLIVAGHGRSQPAAVFTPTGSISLSSEPPGAAIKLNGEVTSYRTPHKVRNLPLGATYQIRLVLDGFEPWAQSFALSKRARDHSATAVLHPETAAALAVIKISTSPSGATLILDGARNPERSPASIAGIQPGIQHTLLVQLPGYDDKLVPLSLEANQVAELNVELERAPLGPNEARLSIVTDPADAELLVGSTPHAGLSPHELVISAGPQIALSVTKIGYATWRKAVRLEPGQTIEMTATLELLHRPPQLARPGAAMGLLVLDSRPWCNVTIDGAPRGQTPIVNLQLSAGHHTGRCVNPQFNINAPFSFTIEPNQTTRKRLSQ